MQDWLQACSSQRSNSQNIFNCSKSFSVSLFLIPAFAGATHLSDSDLLTAPKIYKKTERAGFEPAVPVKGTPVFETGSISHSDTSPD